MTWADVGDPMPRPEPQPYLPVRWPDGATRALASDVPMPTKDFADIAIHRRTQRCFAALDESRLGALLSLTCRVRALGGTHLGFPLSTRPAPSAGAIHPVHLIVHFPAMAGWHRYDPVGHGLIELPSAVSPAEVRCSLDAVLPGGAATVVLFAAEPGMTFAKYCDASSLVWRDAGVLQGFLAAAAEALDLHFCLLGVTGEPWVSRLLDQPGLIGVGAAYVGTAP